MQEVVSIHLWRESNECVVKAFLCCQYQRIRNVLAITTVGLFFLWEKEDMLLEIINRVQTTYRHSMNCIPHLKDIAPSKGELLWATCKWGDRLAQSEHSHLALQLWCHPTQKIQKVLWLCKMQPWQLTWNAYQKPKGISLQHSSTG